MNRLVLVALLLLIPMLPASAQDLALEIIPLKHRPSDEVIPVLKALIGPGGTITGINHQLIVRTTPANLIELRRVLNSIDKAKRRLLITVRQDVAANVLGAEQSLSGNYRSGDFSVASTDGKGAYDGVVVEKRGRDHRVRYRSLSTGGQSDEKNVHFVQTMENQATFIYTGQSVPVAERTVIISDSDSTFHEGIGYRDVTSGFYVVPRINGNTVTLALAPQLQVVNPYRASTVEVQNAETMVSGRLGTWIDLGGATQDFNDDQNVTLTNTHRRASERRRIWVKVEEIP